MSTTRSIDFQSLAIGDSASCELVVTEKDVDAFARLSADDNPLHMDAAFAGERGFPRRVAHGMLALSAISRLIGTQLPGAGALWVAQDFRFAAPVLVGDTLKATVTVEQISRATQIVGLRTEVINLSTGAPVLSGSGKVMVLQPRHRTDSRGTPAGENTPGKAPGHDIA